MKIPLLALLCILCSTGAWAASLGFCRKTSQEVGGANSFGSSSFDPTTKSLFLGTLSNNPPTIFKIDTNAFPSLPTTTTLSLNDAISQYVSLNDPTTGAVYFAGGDYSTGSISRVFAGSWTEWNTFTTGDPILAGVIDEVGGFVYLGTVTGSVLKLATSTFSVVDQIDLAETLRCGIIDTSGGAIYFGSTSGVVVKIDLASFSVVGAPLVLDSSNSLRAAAIDSAQHIGYFGSTATPADLYKVDLTNMAIVDTISLSDGLISSIAIDLTTNLAYIGTYSPGYVTRINLTSFTESGSILMDSDEDFLVTADADTASGIAYFGCSINPGKIVEVQLTDPEQCQHSTCDACNSGCSCGWCASAQTCMSGDSRGPFGESCDAWDYDDCPCTNLTTCAECSTDPHCGWCAETQTCSRGNVTQPYGSTCSQWSVGSCVTCNHTSCDACNADNRCGWCAATQMCMQGDNAAPFAGTCEAWDYGVCPCAHAPSCDACNSDTKCGWCAESQTCFRGNSSFPYGASCQNWDYQDCPCSAAPDCASCSLDSRCGWCAETQTCSQGDASAPFGSTCQAWDFQTCPCESATSCATCNADPRCGWCAESQTCSQGTSSAPYVGTCLAWDYGNCPCDSGTNCSTCNTNALCGWCNSTSTCVRGNAAAPLAGTCPDYNYSTCPLPPQSSCASYASCDSCTLYVECGWCDTTQQCVGGNIASPDSGNCSAWNYVSCPLPPSNCTLYSSCDTCATNPECGWCATSQRCTDGDSTGSFNETCTNWHYSNCTNCGIYNNCSACASNSDCGWCETSHTCTGGNSTTSESGTCADWHFTTCPAPNCTFSNCSSCTSSPECGWCESSQQCKAGTSSASSNGTCSDWHFTICPVPGCAYSTCADCATDAKCGWCSTSNICTAGNVIGPATGSCSVQDWHYKSCPVPKCTLYNANCSACASQDGCGWCESSMKCVPGSASGDANATCSTTNWFYSTCPNNNCTTFGNCSTCSAKYKNCSACATDPACGWCETTQQCTEGNSTSATNGANCTSLSNCTSCTAASNCGWCATTQQCVQGNSTSPANGSCPKWQFTSCPTNCSSYNSCALCVPQSECGWCASTGVCSAGNSSKIETGTCADWRYTTCQQSNFPTLFCANFTSLSSCVSASAQGVACGWCTAGGGACLPGNASRPTNATCGNSTGSGGGGGGGDTWYFGDTCKYQNCSSCTSNPACGWCESTSACVAGNASSAIQYSCPSYYYSSCPWCSQFTNCTQCGTYSNCSWCGSSESNATCVENTYCMGTNFSSACEVGTSGGLVPSKGGDSGLNKGEIAGIVMGIIAALLLFLFLALLIYFYRKPIRDKYRTRRSLDSMHKYMTSTGKSDEVMLDEIIPNTTSMVLSASPNLATSFTPGRDTPPPSPLVLTSTKLIAGPGSAGDIITPDSPSLAPLLAREPSRRHSPSVNRTPKVRKVLPRIEETRPETPPRKPAVPIFTPKKPVALPKSPPPVSQDPTNKYAQLERLLQLPPLEVATALLEVTNPEPDEAEPEVVPDHQSFEAAVNALMCVFANDVTKIALLFEWALTRDVHNAETTDSLFGNGNACASTALARAYFPIVGGAHLASGIGSMVQDICAHPEVYKDRIPAATHRILDAIQISLNQSSLPEPLFHIFQMIESLVGLKFSLPSEKLPQIALTFLLRHYYIAAFLRPKNFGFVATDPSAEARQVLDKILDSIDQIWSESQDLAEAIRVAAASAQDANAPDLFANCEVPKIEGPALPTPQMRDAAFAELHRLLDAFIDDLSSFMGIPLRMFQQDILPKQGEEPFDVLCAVVSAKNPDPLPLLQQILAPDLACLLALFEQMANKPDECDELALAAVHVFESYGQTHRLLLAQITNEAKTTLITSNIFKPPTSVGLRLASYYMKISGSQYLLPTFRSFLDNLDLAKDASYEIDKQKVPNVEMLSKNKESVLKLANDILQLILNSMDNVPFIDRKIYRHMHLIIGKYASHDKSHDALIRLYIDGLIVPALCDPKSYGLLDDDPKPRIHKGLSTVAKILQSAGYGAPYPPNHTMAFANNFIQKNTQTLQDFVDSLAQQAKRPATLPPPVPISEELHRVSVACLHHYLTSYINNADFCYCYMKHCYFHRDEAKSDKAYDKDLRELFFRSPTFYELVLVLNNLGTPPLDKHGNRI